MSFLSSYTGRGVSALIKREEAKAYSLINVVGIPGYCEMNHEFGSLISVCFHSRLSFLNLLFLLTTVVSSPSEAMMRVRGERSRRKSFGRRKSSN